MIDGTLNLFLHSQYIQNYTFKVDDCGDQTLDNQIKKK